VVWRDVDGMRVAMILMSDEICEQTGHLYVRLLGFQRSIEIKGSNLASTPSQVEHERMFLSMTFHDLQGSQYDVEASGRGCCREEICSDLPCEYRPDIYGNPFISMNWVSITTRL
jgi:hypothetical protein